MRVFQYASDPIRACVYFSRVPIWFAQDYFCLFHAVQTALAQLPPVDVYLFRKFVDASVKDLSERLKPGYGRKPRALPVGKTGGWKKASAPSASVPKTVSAKVSLC